MQDFENYEQRMRQTYLALRTAKKQARTISFKMRSKASDLKVKSNMGPSKSQLSKSYKQSADNTPSVNQRKQVQFNNNPQSTQQSHRDSMNATKEVKGISA